MVRCRAEAHIWVVHDCQLARLAIGVSIFHLHLLQLLAVFAGPSVRACGRRRGREECGALRGSPAAVLLLCELVRGFGVRGNLHKVVCRHCLLWLCVHDRGSIG